MHILLTRNFSTYRNSLRYQSLRFLLSLIAFVLPMTSFAWEHTMAHMRIAHLWTCFPDLWPSRCKSISHRELQSSNVTIWRNGRWTSRSLTITHFISTRLIAWSLPSVTSTLLVSPIFSAVSLGLFRPSRWLHSTPLVLISPCNYQIILGSDTQSF